MTVHNIGQRNTKYLQWTRNVAPLTTRVACHHTKTYVPLPLGDNKINTDLARSFKQGWQQSKGGSNAVMDNTTMYEDDYVNCSQKQFKNARQANRRPPQTLTHGVAARRSVGASVPRAPSLRSAQARLGQGRACGTSTSGLRNGWRSRRSTQTLQLYQGAYLADRLGTAAHGHRS